jgi:hypothetical protein
MNTPLRNKIPKISDINTTKKFSSYSPTSKDSNYINYTKEQSITNYLKKNNNLYTNKNSKNFFNVDKPNIFRQYNTYSNINKNLYNNIILNNNGLINNNKNILLTSLFNLPKINKSENKYSPKNKNNKNKIFLLNKNNLEISRISEKYFNNIHDNNEKIKIEENEGISLETHMKDKYYEDIDKKMSIKLQSKNFCHDNSVRERIIKMNKIGLFWGSVFEYCNPLLSATKFRFARKFNLKEKNIRNDDIYVNEYKSKINKDIKPILYTNSLISQIKHNEKIKRELLFYNNINSYPNKLNE